MYKSKKKNQIGFGLLDSLKAGVKSINDKLKSGKYISRGLKTLGTAGNVPIVGSYIAPYQSSLLKAGSRIVFMEALIYNQEGLIVSKGSGTFNAYPKEKAGY